MGYQQPDTSLLNGSSDPSITVIYNTQNQMGWVLYDLNHPLKRDSILS
jgi:hypothetical protein